MSVYTACPKCGSECWDNRAKKAEGKMKATAPDFSCKDRQRCKWAAWPEKPKKAAPQAGPAVRPRTFESWEDLAATFAKAHGYAVRVYGPEVNKARPDVIQSATATLFLAAKDSGLVVRAKETFERESRALQYNPDDDVPF